MGWGKFIGTAGLFGAYIISAMDFVDAILNNCN